MSEFEKLGARRPSIITRHELDELTARRPAPNAIPHPTPEGSEMGALKSGAVQSHERRISQLEVGFGVLRERASVDHRLSAMKGRTRLDFDRSR